MSGMSAEALETFVRDEMSGAGNFLSRALALSDSIDESVLFPDSPYTSPSGAEYRCLSLRDLDLVSQEFSSFYRDHEVTAKDVIAVYLDDGIDFLIQYFALTRLGAIAAFINGNLPIAVAAPYVRSIGASGAMLSADRHDKLAGRLDDSGVSKRLWRRDEVRPGRTPWPKESRYVHRAEDPVLITHSSGTTGFPKAVTAAHKPFFHGVKHRLSHPLQGVERYLCALPLSHNSSVACIAEAVVRGRPIRVQARRDGGSILGAIEEFRPHIVVAFPKQMVEMCARGLAGYNLSSVRYWRSTGDAAHERHIRMLTAVGTSSSSNRSGRGATYIDGLGSSEMGSSLFYIEFDSNSRNHLRCVGKPQPWVTAAVLGDNSCRLDPYSVGRLGVKTPSLTTGYWNNSVLTEKCRENGFWITGDLVYRDAEDNYYHVDRTTDRVDTVDGPLYSLLTEEHILTNFPEVFDCCVYGVADPKSDKQLAVLQVDFNSGKHTCDSLSALLDTVNQYLKERGMPSISRIVQDLRYETYAPEGVTGKVLKRILRESNPTETIAAVRE